MIILGEGNYLMRVGYPKETEKDYIDLKLYHNFGHKTKEEELTESDWNACIQTVRMTPYFAYKLGEQLIKAFAAYDRKDVDFGNN